MKIAPIHREFMKYGDVSSKIVHTGQHYDAQMSGIFFSQLEMPEPDYFLGVGAGSHTQQTAGIMLEFEKVIHIEKPDLVLVAGDVNSTLACALVAVKEQIPVVHVEAGLRSGDRRMPEEINRIMTDSISDQLFVTEDSALVNLKKENIDESKVHFSGNVMIDSLVYYFSKIQNLKIPENIGVAPKSYVLMTMHRPANVDCIEGLKQILEITQQIALRKNVVFPVHPRTMRNMEVNGLKKEFENMACLKMLEPQGYLEFLNLTLNAALVLTDSGGIQEETTFLQIPCITLRETTERPVTVELGTNYLLSNPNIEDVIKLAGEIFKGNAKKGIVPALWDGKAAERIVSVVREKYINSYVCDK